LTAKQPLHLVYYALVQSRYHVAIHVHREGVAAVPEQILHDARMRPGAQEKRRRSMAKVVNADTWQPTGFERMVQRMKDCTVFQHPACLRPEHKAIFSPFRAFCDALQLLLRLMVSKGRYRAGCEMDRAPAALRLWLCKCLAFARLVMKLATDEQRTGIEVYIVPT
jgi:hypothetical protein